MKYKVTVITSFFNAQNSLSRCVKALMEQTLEDIEYIFVDDGSVDNSYELLKELVGNYPNRAPHVVIIKNEKNQGLVYSREIAIRQSKGEYIGFCDADDYPELDLFASLYQLASGNRYDMVWCDFYKTIGNNKHYVCQKIVDETPMGYIRAFLCNRVMGVVWNKLFKSEIIRDERVKTPPYGMMGDVALILQSLLISKNIAYLRKPLYYYCENPNSVTSLGDKHKILRQANQIEKKQQFYFQCFSENGLTKKLSKEIECHKYFLKMWLLPIISNNDDCKKWMQVYPEMNYSLFFNPYISWHQKIISALIELRLYPLIKKLRRA